ncbi:MAG: hypothetical protein ACI9LY_001874 [Arenicella sp.]
MIETETAQQDKLGRRYCYRGQDTLQELVSRNPIFSDVAC